MAIRNHRHQSEIIRCIWWNNIIVWSILPQGSLHFDIQKIHWDDLYGIISSRAFIWLRLFFLSRFLLESTWTDLLLFVVVIIGGVSRVTFCIPPMLWLPMFSFHVLFLWIQNSEFCMMKWLTFFREEGVKILVHLYNFRACWPRVMSQYIPDSWY